TTTYYTCVLSTLTTLRSPLFPYTTLFRSVPAGPWPELRPRGVLRGASDRAGGAGSGLSERREGDSNPRRVAPRRFSRPLQSSARSEEHTFELQSRENLVCRLLLEKKKKRT